MTVEDDVALVALVGAVGVLLAIAFGLAKTETPPSRYDPGVWQALLKPVAGGATALAGVLLLQADLPISPASARSESLFLGYALLFGFSQQLFTQFVDKRAGGSDWGRWHGSKDGVKKQRSDLGVAQGAKSPEQIPNSFEVVEGKCGRRGPAGPRRFRFLKPIR